MQISAQTLQSRRAHLIDIGNAGDDIGQMRVQRRLHVEGFVGAGIARMEKQKRQRQNAKPRQQTARIESEAAQQQGDHGVDQQQRQRQRQKKRLQGDGGGARIILHPRADIAEGRQCIFPIHRIERDLRAFAAV